MIRPVGLIEGHYECRSLKETIPIFTDLLAFEVVEEKKGQAIVKHPNAAWLLVVHESGPGSADKPFMNHYGVRVASHEEVDAACEYITKLKDRYRISHVTPPMENHFAYSFYFKEPGGNFLEIESYDQAAVADGRSIAAPHWGVPLSEDRFPGRGYIPQTLSHGTLESDDKAQSERFYRDVLGLEIVGGGRTSSYVKHPSTPWYIVIIPGRKRHYLSPSSRFTLKVAAPGEVQEAHRSFAASGKELGITELGEIRQQGQKLSFVFSDPDRNWWEITAALG